MSAEQPLAAKKPRPQSVMALNFAGLLDNLFHIDDGLDELSRNVEQRYVVCGDSLTPYSLASYSPHSGGTRPPS